MSFKSPDTDGGGGTAAPGCRSGGSARRGAGIAGGGAHEFGEETFSVEVLLGAHGGFGEFEERGVEVGAGGGRFDDSSGGNFSGPAHEGGFADAAFVEPAFSGAQGEVGCGVAFGGAESAVVGGEDDDGVFVEVELLEGVFMTSPMAASMGFDHAAVNGVVWKRRTFRSPSVPQTGPGGSIRGGFLVVFLSEVIGSLQGGVDGVEGQHGEEGLVLWARMKAFGFVGEARGRCSPSLRLSSLGFL